jgi:hypothetical protein
MDVISEAIAEEWEGVTMAKIDPIAERERLSRLYAGVSDGELGKIAAEEKSLTDIAKEAFAAELERRGMRIEQSAPPGKASDEKTRNEEGGESALQAENPAASATAVIEFTEDELTQVTVRKFRVIPQAMVAKSISRFGGHRVFSGR